MADRLPLTWLFESRLLSGNQLYLQGDSVAIVVEVAANHDVKWNEICRPQPVSFRLFQCSLTYLLLYCGVGP
jgi:hypothetical protein